MAIILPRVEQRPQYGFLSGLSSGLSQGLASAAQSQFEQFQQRRQMEAKRESLRKLGIPESLSELVMNLSPAEQFEVVGNYLRGEEPLLGQEFLGSPLEGLAQQSEPMQRQSQVSDLLDVLGGSQQAQGLEKLLSPEQQRQLRFQKEFGVAPQAAAPAPKAPEAPAIPQPTLQEPTSEQKFFKSVTKGRGGKAEAKEKKIPGAVQTKAFQAIDTADQLESIANQMHDLLKTGKVSSGFKGRLLPTQLQSDETQQFEALSNELASIIAGRSGVATNFKIKLAQAMKPNIAQNPGTQLALTKKLLESASELRRNAKRRLGESGESAMPSANEFPPAQFKGRKVVDDETGATFQSDGSRWVRIQ